ncbi:MAG TPA: hypothetical protein VKR52_11235, partial [Terracidiphilus sp.]|nr:hypothetical protein [Terracidiphilus sp.]
MRTACAHLRVSRARASLAPVTAIVAGGLLLIGARASSQPATTIVLDGASKGRIFDGLGAASAGASSR